MKRVERRPGLTLLALLVGAASPLVVSCAHARGPAAASKEATPADGATSLGALDKFGLYRARRLVLAPIEVARLAPGDTSGDVAPVATLGRARDARSVLLLRFALDLPPETTIVDAHVLLDRAPETEADPAPITLHAARIADPWEVRSLAWGRAPRLADDGLAREQVEAARRVVRLDVAPLVRRWRRHARDDQGIAIVADSATVTGMAFAAADGSPTAVEKPAVLPVRSVADTPPAYFAAPDGADATDGDPRLGPRLELYVRP